MAKKLEWSTVQRTVNDCLPLEINPRKISEEARNKMIQSLEKFNLVDIPVLDYDNTIISGHQRLKALQILGRGEEVIDVRIPNRKLLIGELKEYNLLANTHYGEFDLDALLAGFDDIDMDLIPIDLNKIEFEQSDAIEKSMNNFFNKKADKQIAEEDDFDIPEMGGGGV